MVLAQWESINMNLLLLPSSTTIRQGSWILRCWSYCYPSYPLAAVVRRLQSNSSTSMAFNGSAVTALAAGEPHLGTPSFPLSCIPCMFYYDHLQVCQRAEFSGILVCRAEEPLLRYRYPNRCRFMRKYKGVI